MKLAISIGDLNGIGLEIALRAHNEIKTLCQPIYCIDESMLTWGAAMLGLEIPEDFKTYGCGEPFDITPGIPTAFSGSYAYDSFITALDLTKKKTADAMVTLPINKEAWALANVPYKGHTDALSAILQEDATMMLGCDKLFTALFTHHIPLKDVPKKIKKKTLKNFLVNFYNDVKEPYIGVLGLNPHAGDGGVIGKEDKRIAKAIKKANQALESEIFIGPLVPDTAFTKRNLEKMHYFVCMYHDQGLAPLKALFFEESINVSLGLSIIRTSVDHGTAYDIAYKNKAPSTLSYYNAVKEAVRLIEKHQIFTL